MLSFIPSFPPPVHEVNVFLLCTTERYAYGQVEVVRETRVAFNETVRRQVDFQKQQLEQRHRQQQQFQLQLQQQQRQQRQQTQDRPEPATATPASYSGGFAVSPSLSTGPAAGKAALSSPEALPPPAEGLVMQGGMLSSFLFDGQRRQRLQHQQHQQLQQLQHTQEQRRAATVTPPALLPLHH